MNADPPSRRFEGLVGKSGSSTLVSCRQSRSGWLLSSQVRTWSSRVRTELTFQEAICTALRRLVETLSIQRSLFAGMFLRFTSIALVLLAQVPGVQAQMESSYQNTEEREIYGNGAQGADGDSILDATNPMDLINRIRQAGSIERRHTTSDAIDAALKAYELQPAGTIG